MERERLIPYRARALRALAAHFGILMYTAKENFVKDIIEKIKPKMKEVIKNIVDELRNINPTVDETHAPSVVMTALILVQSLAELIADKYEAKMSEPFFYWLTLFLAEIMLGFNDANCWRYLVWEATQQEEYEKSFITAAQQEDKMYA